MNHAIIKTKLSIPWNRENSISRPALTARLSEGLSRGRRLTLISAPPGYGKTSLAAEWSGMSDARFLWLTLEKEDDEPVRFFSYFIAALQQYDPNLGVSALSLLDSPRFPPADMLAGALINDISELPGKIVLVLDDFQHIRDNAIRETLKHLLENQPQTLHIAMVTRQDPAISLSRLRARDLITELREEDLRFTFQESMDFIRDTMKMQLSEERIRVLEGKTEGWAAGLQLAALSLQDRDEESLVRFFFEFNGTQRYILDYLFEEAFEQLPPEIKDFLTKTSILERLGGPLCDKLLGRRDSAFLLERIQKANLFIIPLDEFGQWYRYHSLFRDILNTELDLDTQRELHLKAAEWFEGNGFVEEAINHAVRAEEYDMLERLLSKTAWSLIQRGEIRTLLARIRSLPEERILRNNEIRLYLALCLLLTGKGKEAASLMSGIDLTELVRYKPEIKANMLVLQIFRSVSFQELVPLRLPEQVSEFVGSSDTVLRTAALYCTAQIASFRGDLDGSVKFYYDAFLNALNADQYFMAMISAKNLSITQLLRGRKREAVNICSEAMERLVDSRGNLLPAASILYVPLGMAYYSEDRLEKAYECFEKGITVCRKLSLIHFAVQGEMSFAILKYAMHDVEGALETIRGAAMSLREIGMEIGLPMFTAIEAELHLRKGDLQFARKWADEMGLEKADMLGVLDERQYFTYARILIAEGRCTEAAFILKRLSEAAEAGERIYRVITAAVLIAINCLKSGLEDEATEALKKAVMMAAPESYHRLFLDEDPCISVLLRKVRNSAPEFVDILIEKYQQEMIHTGGNKGKTEDLIPNGNTSPGFTAGKRPTGEKQPAAGLVEPLSDREQEVLGLVAGGLSNQEIADRLFISLGTTKWHITNIFSKLGVKNRVQAVEAARTILPNGNRIAP